MAVAGSAGKLINKTVKMQQYTWIHSPSTNHTHLARCIFHLTSSIQDCYNIKEMLLGVCDFLSNSWRPLLIC